MQDQRYNVKEALSLLKQGYPMVSALNKQKYRLVFSLKDGKVHILSESGGISLNTVDFLSLYDTAFFYFDKEAMEEETVDIKKDQEYYSWRQ